MAVAGDSQEVVTEGERIDDWDWLGNQTSWDDDASSFYEHSLGTITNGRDEEGEARPSALYLATNIDSIPGIEGGWDGAGWVEVDYGDSGNVESFTVHGECTDTGSDTCTDVPTDNVEDRANNFRSGCTCGVEQHYSYRWDELNRLVDARRYDRVPGTGGGGDEMGSGAEWVYQTRLRYRYDAANQRTVEESFAYGAQNTSHRVALTVYPGHFERRGLERGSGTYNAQGTTTDTDATETQYMVAGARIVWDPEPDTMGGEFDRNRRATVRVSNLLGTSSAVLDIESRELLEVSTYYPSGARENLWTDSAAAPLEPIGFTGKEADEEIGAVYFGERWLIPRLARWATPDPLHVHANGGGEALNSYHYVSGNLLQATDPTGLVRHPAADIDVTPAPGSVSATPRTSHAGFRIVAHSNATLTWLRLGQSSHGHSDPGVVIGVEVPESRTGLNAVEIVQLRNTRIEAQGRSGEYRRIGIQIDVAGSGREMVPRRGQQWRIDGPPPGTLLTDYDLGNPMPANWTDPDRPWPGSGGLGVTSPDAQYIWDRPVRAQLASLLAQQPLSVTSLRSTTEYQTFIRHWEDDPDGGGHYEIDGVVRWSVTAEVSRRADGTVGDVRVTTTLAQDAIQLGASDADRDRLAAAERAHAASRR